MFLAVDGDSSQIPCSYQDVLNFLNLTKGNELYSMTRPVKDFTQPTAVSLELLLYAILDVVSGLSFIPWNIGLLFLLIAGKIWDL